MYPTINKLYLNNKWLSLGIILLLLVIPTVSADTALLGVAPFTVQFNDTSTNSPTEWNWSYTNVTGNNTEIWFSALKDPVETFGVGNWSIRLNATNYLGSNISDFIFYVNVTKAPLSSVFTTDVTEGVVPFIVQFTDISPGYPTNWVWDFGDGNFTNNTIQNPEHTYQDEGVYRVSLTVSNAEELDISSGYIINAYVYTGELPTPELPSPKKKGGDFDIEDDQQFLMSGSRSLELNNSSSLYDSKSSVIDVFQMGVALLAILIVLLAGVIILGMLSKIGVLPFIVPEYFENLPLTMYFGILVGMVVVLITGMMIVTI